MCGIFGYAGKQDTASALVLAGLKQLEYRGYDSWGIAAVGPDGTIAVKKRTGKIGDATTDSLPAVSSLALGHTRWATHGGVTESNAHPHLSCGGHIALVHNGIVENYDALKNNLAKRHAFVSETDSEVVAHAIEDLARTLPFPEAVRQAFLTLDGANAVIALDPLGRQLVAVRNGSPLVLGYGDGEYLVASDASAILPYTRRVHFLEDNEMAVIDKDGIAVFDAAAGTRKRVRTHTLTWTQETATKGGFDTFMLKEIHEQPDMLARIAASGDPALSQLAKRIQGARRVTFIGCGSASYACMYASQLLTAIAGIDARWAIGSEFGFQLQTVGPGQLVIAVTQSGETMDTIESMKKAAVRGADIAAITNVVGSTASRIARLSVPLGAGPEIAVASTKALTAMFALAVRLAHLVAGRDAEGREAVAKAATAVRVVLSDENQQAVNAIAASMTGATHAFAIGRGLSYPTALETALKIKEIAYIHAEGLAAGELKHGPLALIEPGTPCIALLPNDETYGANLAGAMELKARGGTIIGMARARHTIFDAFIRVSDAGPATPIGHIAAAQLLAYRLTLARGFDADKPRNLAKSVTVK